MGESKDAEKWAALARAHHVRAGQLLSPDGYYYEGFEYWIFSTPWLVHFLDAWEHSTGENLWNRDVFRNWKPYLAHSLLPDGQNVFDFGDIWEGALTRAKTGAEYPRVYPGGTLQSNFNVMYRVAARLKDPQAQAVAERYASFGHSNLEEFWTLLWRDPSLKPAAMDSIPLSHHFEDSGVVYARTSWNKDATAIAFKAGPPEGHRVAALLPKLPEWRLDSGHAHPDAGSFIVWAHGRYLTGDTGYAGLPSARNHNTMTIGGIGQGVETQHDVWRQMDYRLLSGIRIRDVNLTGGTMRLVADLAAAYPPSAGVKAFNRAFEWNGASSIIVTDTVTLRQAIAVGVAPAVRHGVHRPGHDVCERPRRRTGASGVVRIAGGDGHDGPGQRQGPRASRIDRERRRGAARLRAHGESAGGSDGPIRGQARLGCVSKRITTTDRSRIRSQLFSACLPGENH